MRARARARHTHKQRSPFLPSNCLKPIHHTRAQNKTAFRVHRALAIAHITLFLTNRYLSFLRSCAQSKVYSHPLRYLGLMRKMIYLGCCGSCIGMVLLTAVLMILLLGQFGNKQLPTIIISIILPLCCAVACGSLSWAFWKINEHMTPITSEQ